MSIKNPFTPAGIEPATFRFVAHHLNHCATAVPLPQRVLDRKNTQGCPFVCDYHSAAHVQSSKISRRACGEEAHIPRLLKLGAKWITVLQKQRRQFSYNATHSSTFMFADSLLASCQQTCMTYTFAVCTVKNSWWWTEELSETCRVLFQKWIWEISASRWFYYYFKISLL